MDKTIRRNEICVIGMPRCDFVFSSTRTCFIAYGFEESPLEMTILRRLLEERSIQPLEAGGALAPAQNAFCAKICSKIITAQFCAILLNNEESDGNEIPNANVNMEYGLMLGFNKYVIPFQRSSQTLPFNVAGLDTIKYTDTDFERLAGEAIDQAIHETRQDTPSDYSPDQIQVNFLLTRRALVSPLTTDGERNIFELGRPLGFNLLNDFTGLNYMYFGNFTALRPEAAIWRVHMLTEILNGRRTSLDTRVEAEMTTEKEAQAAEDLLNRMEIWVLLTTNEDKEKVCEALGSTDYTVDVFSVAEVSSELEKLSSAGT